MRIREGIASFARLLRIGVWFGGKERSFGERKDLWEEEAWMEGWREGNEQKWGGFERVKCLWEMEGEKERKVLQKWKSCLLPRLRTREKNRPLQKALDWESGSNG